MAGDQQRGGSATGGEASQHGDADQALGAGKLSPSSPHLITIDAVYASKLIADAWGGMPIISRYEDIRRTAQEQLQNAALLMVPEGDAVDKIAAITTDVEWLRSLAPLHVYPVAERLRQIANNLVTNMRKELNNSEEVTRVTRQKEAMDRQLTELRAELSEAQNLQATWQRIARAMGYENHTGAWTPTLFSPVISDKIRAALEAHSQRLIEPFVRALKVTQDSFMLHAKIAKAMGYQNPSYSWNRAEFDDATGDAIHKSRMAVRAIIKGEDKATTADADPKLLRYAVSATPNGYRNIIWAPSVADAISKVPPTFTVTSVFEMDEGNFIPTFSPALYRQMWGRAYRPWSTRPSDVGFGVFSGNGLGDQPSPPTPNAQDKALARDAQKIIDAVIALAETAMAVRIVVTPSITLEETLKSRGKIDALRALAASFQKLVGV